jgi:uncharacterized FAD-dependent dehydrogenase
LAELTFEEQVKNILEESKNDIVEQTKAAVKEKIIYSLNWNLGNEISTYVKKYIEEYLIEYVKHYTWFESEQGYARCILDGCRSIPLGL